MKGTRYGWLLLVILGSGGEAQTAGQHRGLFFTTSNWKTPPISAVGLVDPWNAVAAYPTHSNGPWPYWGNTFAAVQDVNNRDVIVPGLLGQGSPPLYKPDRYVFARFDPLRRSIASTLWSSPFNKGPPRNLTNLTLNSDGDLVGVDSLQDRIFVLDRQSGTWSDTTLPRGMMNGGLGGLEWDKLNGGYFQASARYSGDQVLLKTSWDLSSHQVLAAAASALQANCGGSALENGDWVSSSYALPHTYLEVKAGRGRWQGESILPNGLFTDVTAEKYAAAGRGYYAAFITQRLVQGVGYVDATTTPHTLTTLVSGPLPSWSGGFIMEILPLFDRDLATVRAGKSNWTVVLNPGPGAFVGRPFTIVASLAGAATPRALPDGRQLFLNPDWLTVRSAQGPIRPFFTGNTGTLNVYGMGIAKLDLTWLGSQANGTVIHLLGLVLDPAAPSGIAWVSDPWAFVVNVRP